MSTKAKEKKLRKGYGRLVGTSIYTNKEIHDKVLRNYGSVNSYPDINNLHKFI